MICDSIKDWHLDVALPFTISAESIYDSKIKQDALKIANVLYSVNIESNLKF